MDILLPKMTGLAVLHEIRRISGLPVLVLTAIGDEYTQGQSQLPDTMTFGEVTVDFSGYTARDQGGESS